MYILNRKIYSLIIFCIFQQAKFFYIKYFITFPKSIKISFTLYKNTNHLKNSQLEYLDFPQLNSSRLIHLSIRNKYGQK